MGGKSRQVFEVVRGWEAVELVLKCIFLGAWQLVQIWVKRLWRGHRRRPKDYSPVELTVDSSVGTHCYIKIMGVKYHYVESGPKSGQVVLILGDAPDNGNLWGPSWTRVVRKLTEAGYHAVTLDLRGTGGSEGGGRGDLAPPRAVQELAALLGALGVSEARPAVLLGFGIGGMLTWYMAHAHGRAVSKFAAVGAPHPNLYWTYPPAEFCQNALHFIQWPYLPEQWLADTAGRGGEGAEGRWASSRARDWAGALHYIRGAGWWRIVGSHVAAAPALLVAGRAGAGAGAAQLVASAAHCAAPTLRMVARPDPSDRELADIVLDFLIEKEKPAEVESRTLVGRMLGAVAGRGRELTAKLV